MSGTPPEIPIQFQIYDSYAEDPKWQRKFSIIWASVLAGAILYSLPRFIRSVRNRKVFTGLFGVSEDFAGKNYEVMRNHERPSSHSSRRLAAIIRTLGSVLLWSPPGLELNFGQILVILGYLVVVLVCIIVKAPLIDNPNRAGFLALAQLPPVFLFAMKNSPLYPLLGSGFGYEKMNYIHRWSGRCLGLGALVHGSLWIRNHLQYDLPILGQQKETSGVAALGILAIIVLSSLKPIRRAFYQLFFIVHVLGFVSFFIVICYHTIYAAPWIFPPIAFYGLDILMRMFRYRIKDASLVAVDKQMTLIQIHNCDSGWIAGQHVRLRVFFNGRIFESHPLTILSAPPSTSCLPSAASHSLLLGARVKGDWTRALNAYTSSEQERLRLAAKSVESCHEEPEAGCEAQAQVMIDGPYGGCTLDLGRYSRVLLVSGGSGATFAIGLLDDLVGRCVRLGRPRRERTRHVEFVWCVKSYGCIEWFAPQLQAIASVASESQTLDVHITIFVTCMCNPDAVPPIPNSSVVVEPRPPVRSLLVALVDGPSSPSSSAAGFGDEESRGAEIEEVSIENVQSEQTEKDVSLEKGATDSREPGRYWTTARPAMATAEDRGGGVAVCASGPETLTRDASNAVARMGMVRGLELGGIALHTELFAM